MTTITTTMTSTEMTMTMTKTTMSTSFYYTATNLSWMNSWQSGGDLYDDDDNDDYDNDDEDEDVISDLVGYLILFKVAQMQQRRADNFIIL
jgi:hypothetical protein